MWEQYWEDRGSPWDYDPGPAKNRSWSRLFAETPNYRAFGIAMSGHEEFRWHFGPMFYRGRLGDQQVKVLVVGQEGAQDESLSHRSFTGGTGGRMQHFLGHIGINRSYLFLNTFVYPIFGQYDGLLPIIAQHPSSPIAQHRKKLFDYVALRNDLQLVVAVGRAAKESLASWVESHGGTADPDKLHLADASLISPGLHLVGVLHPGGAGKGGAVAAIIASFEAAINRVHDWIADDPSWLPVDPGAVRATMPYTYSSDPIPFRDFPYGVPWRLGRGSTSSNRRDGQASIQIFSEDGKYNNDGVTLTYAASGAGTDDGYSADVGDVAWEPARRTHKEFDRGPGDTFAALLQGGKPGFDWPDFTTFGLQCSPSFGTGPIFRGRLDRPSILVVADQQSQDDLFTMRALTGDDGQHLQAFLRSAGLIGRYAILRVLPVDSLADNQTAVAAAVDSPSVRAIYAEAIRLARPQVLLFVGPLSQRLRDHVTPNGTPVVKMKSRLQSGADVSWQAALNDLASLSYRRDVTPTFSYTGEREQIPRQDLPFGTLRWQASSGNRGSQAKHNGSPSFDYSKVTMPAWTAATIAPPLSASEAAAAEILRNL
ncbi:MAG: uracil-DNA glycosylase family protein [Ilumatobacteraceae bacterium]